MFEEIIKKPIIISLIAAIILYFILSNMPDSVTKDKEETDLNTETSETSSNKWYDKNTIIYSVITGVVIFFGMRALKGGDNSSDSSSTANQTVVSSIGESGGDVVNKKLVNGENILVSPY